MRVYGALVRYCANYDCYGFYGLVFAVLEDVAEVAGEEAVVQEAVSARAVVQLESPVATQGSAPSQLFQGDVVVKEEQVRVEVVESVLGYVEVVEAVLGYNVEVESVEVVEPELGYVEVVESVLVYVEAVEPLLGYVVAVESVLVYVVAVESVLVYVEVESVEAVESVLGNIEVVEPVLQVEVVAAAVEPSEPEEAPAEAV